MSTADRHDVVVVGSGVAGLSASIFTARAGLETLVVNDDESILERNAQIENYPGFPAGVNSRLLLELSRDHAARSGVTFEEDEVVAVEPTEDGFDVHLADVTLATEFVVAASWSDVGFLDGLDLDLIEQGSKRYVEVDEHGRTGVEGLYAAGRIAGQYHQAIVAAGHGADVALTLVDDSDVPYYHDWIAPEGYFTGRGREVPPGVEEIDEAERKRREAESMAVMREYFADPHPGTPTMHPSVEQDD